MMSLLQIMFFFVHMLRMLHMLRTCMCVTCVTCIMSATPMKLVILKVVLVRNDYAYFVGDSYKA